MLANWPQSAFGRDLRRRESVLLAAGGDLFGLSSLGFAELAEDVAENDPIVRWDSTIARWLHTHATDAPTEFLRVVTGRAGSSRNRDRRQGSYPLRAILPAA